MGKQRCKTKYLNYKSYFLKHIFLRLLFTKPMTDHYVYFRTHISAKLNIFNCHTCKGDNMSLTLHLSIPLS